MDKKNIKHFKDTTRSSYLKQVINLLEGNGEEVYQIKSNEISIPVAVEGVEFYVNIVVKVPRGSKGEEYEPYIQAEEYKQKQQQENRKQGGDKK